MINKCFSLSISKSGNRFTSSPEREFFPDEHKLKQQKLTFAEINEHLINEVS